MDQNQVVDLAVRALMLAAELAAPLLITALVVGFAISVFQSITQIQEATLSFVPKAIVFGRCPSGTLLSRNSKCTRLSSRSAQVKNSPGMPE